MLALVGRSWNGDLSKDWPGSDPITGGSEADVLVALSSVLSGKSNAGALGDWLTRVSVMTGEERRGRTTQRGSK